MAAGHGAFHRLGVPGYLMCHLSHSYHAGACLYFTFALNPPDDRDALADYGVVKRAIQQAFVDSGATLSHHHAVGTEHAQWLEEDISTPGVAMLRALFGGTDPGANLNPGKIVAAGPDRGETIPGGESSKSNGRTGGPRHSLDASQSSQPPP
jgi:alkyldihydroxyacetonephosphate synthase